MLNKAVSLNRHSRKIRSMGNVAQRGLSLIEVLFVIVILIIGILTIAQIFPIGFGGLRAAGNTSLAERLAQQQLDKLQSDPGGVPDGVYSQYVNVSGNTASLFFDPTYKSADLGTYSRNSADAPAVAARYNREMNDINKTRYISNESHRIAAQRFNTNVSAPNPILALNYGPIFLPSGLEASWPQFINVVSGDWAAKTGNSEANLTQGADAPIDIPTDFLTPSQPNYLVDYANQRIAVPPQPFPQSFYFQVDVIDSTGARSTKLFSFGVTSSTAASGYSGSWFPSNGALNDFYVEPVIAVNTWPTTANGFTWIVGTARLFRPFTYQVDVAHFVNQTATDPQDPYQFTLHPNAFFGTSDVNAGVLVFPTSAAQPGIGTAIVAKVSYSTFDWHILHEDRDVSQGANIRLTMHDLKKVGDTGTNGTIYPGLIPNIGTGVDNFDVILLDLDSGDILSAYTDTQSNDLDQTSSGSVKDFLGISYRNGRLALPTNLPQNVSHLRIFYATANDLGVAVRMAPKTYHLVPWSLTSVTNVGDSSTPNRYAYEPGANAGTIDFPPCDQGKSIQLSGVQYTDINGGLRNVPSIQLVLPAAIGTKPVTIFLASLIPTTDPAAAMDSSKPFGLTSVVGLSASTIAVWRENGVWKQRSLETTVGRS